MRVGTCGWNRFDARKLFGEDWKEQFSSKLAAYAQLFNVVEVNSTFYRMPRISTAQRWRLEVPENFGFTVKAYRGITHEKRFVRVNEYVDATLEVARALKAQIILLQTPKSFRKTKENARRVLDFLSTLPEKFDYALELRGWDYDTRFAEWIWVVDPFAQQPPEQDAYYFRLHGSPPGERLYHYRYTDDDLHWLRDLVMSLGKKRVWVFFNNTGMYDDALRFKGMLNGKR